MKAVFSFWNTSGNALIKATNWANPKFQLYSWVLAVNQAARFFDEVELITDSESVPIFEKLGLPFTSIRTDLDELKNYPKSFWALGKIKAYQVQDKPFVHIDNDFIMFLKPPTWFLESRIGFQNTEDGNWFEGAYRGQFNNLNENGKGLPESWGLVNEAFNFGIYSCNDMEYNRKYCEEAFQLVNNNTELILETGHPGLYCVLFEQYIGATTAKLLNLEPTFLSKECNHKDIEKLGLIHIWGAKQDNTWYENIEKIVRNEHPKQFDIINNVLY
jgi:hypothetical protein